MKFEELYTFTYIDALPLEYVRPEYMPNLFKLLGNEAEPINVLQNIPGYSFGIQSTLLSGFLPQETFHWMPYVFRTDEIERRFDYLISPCSYNQVVCSALSQRIMNTLRSTKSGRLGLLYQGLMRTGVFWKKRSVKLSGASVDQLRKMFVFPYYYINENPFFVMFKKELEKRFNVAVYYLGHSLRKVINNLSQAIKAAKMHENSKLLILAYIDDLDRVGHGKGVASIEWLNTLKSIDFFIGYMYKYFSAISKNIKIFVFSDHGMCNTDEYIDLEKILRTFSEDSIDFIIDATLAFIRVHNDRHKKLLINLLEKKLKNKVLILDVEEHRYELKCLGIHFANGEYGDIIVQTKPCKEFLPNFYSVSCGLKGLHGFWPSEALQRAFILSIPPKDEASKKPLHIKDVKKYLLLNFSGEL